MKLLLRTCRRLLRELKAASPAGEAGEQWRYIVSAVRLGDTGRESSVDHESSVNTLESYLAYLESSRQHRELLEHYQGRGERSIEETAKLVGLKLPQNGTETVHATPEHGTETEKLASIK